MILTFETSMKIAPTHIILYIFGAISYVGVLVLIYFSHSRYENRCGWLVRLGRATPGLVDLGSRHGGENRRLKRESVEECLKSFSLPVLKCIFSKANFNGSEDSNLLDSTNSTSCTTSLHTKSSSHENISSLDRNLVRDQNIFVPPPGVCQVVNNCSREVSGECVICLGKYNRGLNDNVVWSSNKDCPHVFHYECMISWLCRETENPRRQ